MTIASNNISHINIQNIVNDRISPQLKFLSTEVQIEKARFILQTSLNQPHCSYDGNLDYAQCIYQIENAKHKHAETRDVVIQLIYQRLRYFLLLPTQIETIENITGSLYNHDVSLKYYYDQTQQLVAQIFRLLSLKKTAQSECMEYRDDHVLDLSRDIALNSQLAGYSNLILILLAQELSLVLQRTKEEYQAQWEADIQKTFITACLKVFEKIYSLNDLTDFYQQIQTSLMDMDDDIGLIQQAYVIRSRAFTLDIGCINAACLSNIPFTPEEDEEALSVRPKM